ncbi:hypothetical protein Q5P01_002186 [Channa striata]|uniref:Uncharacterized protein n=1 Tax=Channa striata TaxID=64152 RepID=A0AA88T5X9_CHASR|nr:hypothetical protein Q5P01_002186 [Channa striata]
MGTILQEQAPQRCVDREWKRRTSGRNNRPNVASSTVVLGGRSAWCACVCAVIYCNMGRQQPQRKSLQPQYTLPSLENHHDKDQLITF